MAESASLLLGCQLTGEDPHGDAVGSVFHISCPVRWCSHCPWKVDVALRDIVTGYGRDGSTVGLDYVSGLFQPL